MVLGSKGSKVTHEQHCLKQYKGRHIHLLSYYQKGEISSISPVGRKPALCSTLLQMLSWSFPYIIFTHHAKLRREPGINSWQSGTLQVNQLVLEIYYTDVSWLHSWAKEVSLPEAWLVMASAWNWSLTAYLSQNPHSLFSKIISLAHTYIS